MTNDVHLFDRPKTTNLYRVSELLAFHARVPPSLSNVSGLAWENLSGRMMFDNFTCLLLSFYFLLRIDTEDSRRTLKRKSLEQWNE